MPTITQLEYILAVDSLRHFGRAAEACHISQPTLSMQIQKLEDEVGYPIFDRLKKPIVPTAKGQAFITQAKVLIREHKKLIELSKAQLGELNGEIKLGVIPTVTPYLLPLFVSHFSKTFPKVELVIDELKTESIIQKLKEDQIDAGILATPLTERGIHERPLYYEPFYLYVSKSHPLNQRKRIRDQDLKPENMWLLGDGHCFRNQIARFCSLKKSNGVFPNVQFEGGNIDTLRNLIRKSEGYTLVPALFVETLSDSETREFVREFEKPAPAREISLVFRRDQWKTDLIEALAVSILAKIPNELKTLDPKKQDVLPIT